MLLHSHFHFPIPVLTYHRVLPCAAPYAISDDEFERQLIWLRANKFVSLSGADFEHALCGGIDTRRKVLITFDDGYLDNWYLATPLLRKYGFKALVFVITEKIQAQQPRSIGKWDEMGDQVFLSWQEIDAMVESGVFEVHSHTHTHTKLWGNEISTFDTCQSICRDVATSLQILRSRYQHDIQLAWPWGYFRKEWLSEISKMGVKICHTMRPGTNFPGCDLRVIRRLNEDSLSSRKQQRFSAAASPLIGRGFNTVSTIVGALRNRP